MKARKTNRKIKPAAKSKDLTPRKSKDVKGGSFDLGKLVGNVVKSTIPPAL